MPFSGRNDVKMTAKWRRNDGKVTANNKPEMREKYQNDKYTKFLPRESQELHSTFIVDGKAFTFFQSMIKSLVVEI